jgi:hypothetical protein
VRKLETAKNHRKPWKFKMDNLKKREGFEIRSAPLQGPADRIWLADNFVCTSIFLSAFTMDGAKLLFLLVGILIIFHCSTWYLLWVIVECLFVLSNVYSISPCRCVGKNRFVVPRCFCNISWSIFIDFCALSTNLSIFFGKKSKMAAIFE